MTRMDFTALFYSQVHNRETLLSGLDSLLGTEVHPVTIVPYASEQPPAECFEAGGRNRSLRPLGVYDDVTLFELAFHPTKMERETEVVKGKFFVCEHPSFQNVFLAITVESADFVRRALLPFIEQNRSQIYLTFIRHDDLHSLLQNLRDGHGFSDLRVVRASLISRRGETIIPSLSWPRLGLEGAFEYAQEQNGWFKSLTFEALRASKVFAATSVYRNGVVRTDGEFDAVYGSLVLPMCQAINENVALFAGRGRRENPHLAVRPLAIDFGRDQFEDTEENVKLISAMRELENASVSVMHGNPYVSLSVVDYFDGSTFDLWVLNPREVIIVPQLKSSIAGIRRLISCIFDNYAEGAIRDFHTLRQ